MTITYEAVQAFLYREARPLDDQQWDDWLEFYAAGRRVLDAVVGRRRQADRPTRSARSR